MQSSVATTHSEKRGRESILSEAVGPSRRRGVSRVRVLARSLFLADVVAALVAALVVSLAMATSLRDAALLAVATTVLWPFITFSVGLYVTDGLRAWISGVGDASRLVVAGLLLSWPIFLVCLLLDVPVPGVTMVWTVAATLLLTAVSRAVTRALLHRVGSLQQQALIVGSGVVAGQVAEKLTTHVQFGLNPIGIVDDDVHEVGTPDLPRLGGLGQLDALLDELDVSRVIIAFSRASHDQLLAAIRSCRDHGVAVDVVPRLFEFIDGARSLDHVAGLPVLSIGTASLSKPAHAIKRIADVLLSFGCLLVMLPVFVAIAIAIKVESRGPVFFRQVRAGRRGRPFQLIKFRSMYVGADERKDDYADQNDLLDGVMFKIQRDPRVTRVGAFLRRTSLDEMPQLINVLKGEMSLVGPRPLILSESGSLEADWHQRRLDLRPGMTGPWQINGRSQTPFQEMLRFDYQYVAGWSLGRDFEILLGTIPAVLSQRGAY